MAKINIKNPITIFNKVEEINGVPIEIDTLDSDLLVAENEGKVYKCGGKLYRVVADIENANLVSLLGATITVPSGWSATAGYGKFSIKGKIDNKTLSLFYIGYYRSNKLWADPNFIMYNNEVDQQITPTSSFVLYITDGIDVTNQRLIDWFVDNGAVIDGGQWTGYIFQEILSPSGTLDVTANGEVDVKEYEKVNVNVGIKEVATETEMNALLVEANIGKVYRFTGTTGTYTNGDLYEVVSE